MWDFSYANIHACKHFKFGNGVFELKPTNKRDNTKNTTYTKTHTHTKNIHPSARAHAHANTYTQTLNFYP